jgi:arylsulfatase A-like enzyme
MGNFDRRLFLKGSAVGAFSLAFGGCGMPKVFDKRSKRPNVLVILTDDQGYGDVGYAGTGDIRTPNIDSICREGIRFDNFHSNCPVCSPTRASLLTGRYPDLVGVPGVIREELPFGNFGFMAPEAVTLPEVLKKAGYHTSAIGKWHLGLSSPNLPNERGFDHFSGFLGDMMDDYFTHLRHGYNFMRINEKTVDPEGHATDIFTGWTCQYLEERAESDKPFFCYLAYNAPHTPIQPRSDWLSKVKKREAGVSEKRAKILALIEHMDDGVGEVLRKLEETGQAENTLIIFTSDNGGQLSAGANNEPLRGGKQQMLEGGIGVPFCACWAGKIAAGSRCEKLAVTMDIFATVCEVAGVNGPCDIEAESFLPELLGEERVQKDRLTFWMRREGGKYRGRCYYAARLGDYKLLQNTSFEPMTLYNLREDPREMNPLAATHPMYKKLSNALSNHIIRAGAVPWQGPGALDVDLNEL